MKIIKILLCVKGAKMKMKKYIKFLLMLLICLGIYVIFFQYTHKEMQSAGGLDAISTGNFIEDQFEFSQDDLEDLDINDYLPEENMTIKKYAANELSSKVFTTPEERHGLFKKLGMEYLFQEIFAYQHKNPADIKDNEMYRENPEIYDGLSMLYKDDVQAQTLVPMSIRWLGSDVGYGIFAESDLAEDDFIGIYVGVVQDRELTENKDYAWQYPTTTDDGGTMIIDGSEKGNELRFINDGVNPNCIVRYVMGHDNLWHVCYTALKDIKKGEQLLISYGPAYWDTRVYKYKELADPK